MTTITLHLDDLSFEVVEAIRDDMSKYGHLKAYEKLFSILNEEVAERKLRQAPKG